MLFSTMKHFVIAATLIGLPSIKVIADTGTLYINEIQVANIDRYLDPSNNYGGWIELYNPSDNDVNLSGMILRHIDSDEAIETYTLTSNHGKVAAKGFACLWFDHNSKDGYYGTKAKTQIPYKLDADGGQIVLLDAVGNTLSSVTYPKAISRSSYLRKNDGGNEWSWTSFPTPASSNNNVPFASQRLAAPEVSTESKVFSSDFSFRVSIPSNSTLYYTTDGSTPIVGKSAVSKDGKFSVDKTTIYRFLLAHEGYLNSQVVTRSFIRNKGEYYLPIVSISTHPDNLYDPKIGVYVYGTNGREALGSGKKANQNMDWERPVNFEYLVPGDNKEYSLEFCQEVSLSIFGGYSRFKGGNEDWETRSSFKLKAEKQYEGENVLSYPFFDSKPYIKLKSILVRNGGSDQEGRIVDPSVAEIVRTSGVYADCQSYLPSQVFFNGKYLGMLNLREETNKRYAYSNYGIETDDVDQWEKDYVINVGDSKKLSNWYSLCGQLAKSPTNKTIWQKIESILDIDEYCNYMAIMSFAGNYDWFRKEDWFNNLKAFCGRSDNAKIHHVIFDLDCTFGHTDILLQILASSKSKHAKAFNNMLKYEPFKKQFIDAYCIAGGSIFEETRSKAIMDEIAERADAAMQMEGGSSKKRSESFYARMVSMHPEMIETLKEAFNLKDEYFVNLSASTTTGHRFLLNGQEIPTGKFNGSMFAPITLTAVAPAGYNFDSWKVDGKVLAYDSILNLDEKMKTGAYSITAHFKENSKSKMAPIRINEVSAGNDIFINEYGKKVDFIELYNTTAQPIDVSGCYLSDNAAKPQKYQITGGKKPADTVIPAHGHKVIWCDKGETGIQIHANFKLDNRDSAYVILTAADGSWSDHLVYKAQPRWHSFGRYPDGGDQVTLFSYPTIGAANRFDREVVLSPQTDLPENQEEPESILNIETSFPSKTIYYNLQGQPLKSLPSTGIIIINNHNESKIWQRY